MGRSKVRDYTRRLKSGKVVKVRGHDRNGKDAELSHAVPQSKAKRGEEFEAHKKARAVVETDPARIAWFNKTALGWHALSDDDKTKLWASADKTQRANIKAALKHKTVTLNPTHSSDVEPEKRKLKPKSKPQPAAPVVKAKPKATFEVTPAQPNTNGARGTVNTPLTDMPDPKSYTGSRVPLSDFSGNQRVGPPTAKKPRENGAASAPKNNAGEPIFSQQMAAYKKKHLKAGTPTYNASRKNQKSTRDNVKRVFGSKKKKS